MRAANVVLGVTATWAVVATALWLDARAARGDPTPTRDRTEAAERPTPAPQADTTGLGRASPPQTAPGAGASPAQADDAGAAHARSAAVVEALRQASPAVATGTEAPPSCTCPPLPSSLGITPAEKQRLAECERGDTAACSSLIHGASSAVLSARAAAMGCNRGDANACALLGHFTLEGTGVDANPTAGLDLLRKACAADPHECFYLALDGAELVPGEAFEAARRGCTARYDLACEKAGDLARAGKGAGAAHEAAAWYEAGCALGGADSCEALLEMSEKNELGPVSAPVLAARRKRACETGTLSACDALRR